MFRIFYAEKDTTLYESVETANAGVDEILEIGKRLNTSGDTLQKSRALVKFDISEISNVISKYNVDLSNCKFMLQLYTTHAKNLPSDFSIDIKLVAQPWTNGTGFYSDNPTTTNGASWSIPYASWSLDSKSGSMWISSSQNIQVNSSSIYISGSGTGGSWYYQPTASIIDINNFNQTFNNQSSTDIVTDVTDAIKLWISGSNNHTVDNNGFLLKLSDADEANPLVSGYIGYFSKETHTIYVPKLTLYWDNSTFTTGSLAGIDTESYTVYTHVKPTYKDTEIAKIRIYARDKYPRKSPTNLFPLQTIKHLPQSTYYTVLDAVTDETIIPYDDIYTKVSCDATSNFIYLDLNGFMPERYYRLELKVKSGIEEQYITDQIYFKVIR